MTLPESDLRSFGPHRANSGSPLNEVLGLALPRREQSTCRALRVAAFSLAPH